MRRPPAALLGRAWLTLGVAMLAAGPALAQCPDRCNGNGDCTTDSLCSCFPGWTGPSCRLRVCPSGPAWVAKTSSAGATASTSAERPVLECSNAGTCDRQAGLCRCFAGFTGPVCERTDCPNKCSSRGQCLTIEGINRIYGSDASPGETGDGAVLPFVGWEANRLSSCFCDRGYSGPDCSQQLCQRGDDPRTRYQQDRTVVITTGVSGSDARLGGGFNLRFLGQSSTDVLPAGATAAQAEAAWATVGGIGGASCSRPSFNETTFAATYVCRLHFAREAAANNVLEHQGNPDLTQFSCDARPAAAATAANVTCLISNHNNNLTMVNGTTKGDLGNTAGIGSSTSEGRVYGAVDLELRILNDTSVPNTFVFGPLSRVDDSVEYPIDSAAPMTVSALDGNVTVQVQFASAVGHTAGARWVLQVGNTSKFHVVSYPGTKEHIACSGNGVCNQGVCTCFGLSTGGACQVVPSAELFGADEPYLNVFIANPSYKGNAFVVETLRDESPDFNFFMAIANQNTLFRVDGTGMVWSDSASIQRRTTTKFLTVTNGATITSGGLRIEAAGQTIVSGGLSVKDDSTQLETMQPLSPALVVNSTADYRSSALAILSVAERPNTTFSFLSVLTRHQDEIFSIAGNGRLTLSGPDVVNNEGGLDVQLGGATVVGGIQVPTVGITSAGAILLQENTPANDLLTVSNPNATYSAGALVTLTTATPASAADFWFVQARAAGSDVFEVSGNGLVTIHRGGMDILAGGANVSGATVLHNSLTVLAGGASVAGGLSVSGSATIASNEDTTPILDIEASTSTFISDVLRIGAQAKTNLSTDYNLIHAVGSNFTVFRVQGDGSTYIGAGVQSSVYFNATIQGEIPLRFGGPEGDNDTATLALHVNDLSVDRDIYVPDASGVMAVIDFADFANPSPGRVIYTSDNGGKLVSSPDFFFNETVSYLTTTDYIAISAGSSAPLTLSGGHVVLQAKETSSGGGHVSLTAGPSTSLTESGGSVMIASGAGSSSSTGNVAVHSADAVSAGVTGWIELATGDSAADDSGAISVKSGVSSTANSGVVMIVSGSAAAGTSGGVQLASGPGDASGTATISSGAGSTGSGATVVTTGDASGGTSGTVTVSTGAGTAGTGALTVATGTASGGPSGALALSSGGGTTGTGGVTVASGVASAGASGTLLLSSGAASGGSSGHAILAAGAVSGGSAAGSISLLGGTGDSGNGGSIYLEPGSSSTGTAGSVQIGGGSPFRAVFAGAVDLSSKWTSSTTLAAGERNKDTFSGADIASIVNWTPAVGDIVLVQPQFDHDGSSSDDFMHVSGRVSAAGDLEITVANSQGSTTSLSAYLTGTYGIVVYRV